ncbi:MAG: hypothetical protein WCQ87_11595, partial [Parabacteroides sp.]
MKKLFYLALVFMTVMGVSALDLVKDGIPKAGIVVSAKASDYTQYAARELADHIELTTGAKLQIFTDQNKLPNGLIPVYVGLSDATKKLGVDSMLFKPDQFVIRTGKNYMIIAGHDLKSGVIPQYPRHPMRWQDTWDKDLKLSAFGEAGSLYGVYRFLEDFAGVRWY